jgi:predicted porin
MKNIGVSMSFQHKGSVNRSIKFNKKLLPATLGLLISTNAFAGFPTIYGKIDLTLNQYDLEKNDFVAGATAGTFRHTGALATTTELDNASLESNGSRFGIRGDADVAEGLKVVYKIEYGVDVDNGTNSNGRELTQRNITAGLQGDWGTIVGGKNDTPLKTVQTNSVYQSDIDRFNDLPLADIGTYLVGENRADNTIQYSSPILLGGLEINLAAIQSEETGVEVPVAGTAAPNPQNDNGFAAGKSLSVVYGKSKWYFGVAVDGNVAATDAVRAAGEITVGPVKIGAIYQTAERHEDFDVIGPFSTFINSAVTSVGAQNGLNPFSEWDGVGGSSYKKQDGYVVNALWKIAGPWSAKIQYGHSTSTPTSTPTSVPPTVAATEYEDVDIDAIAAGVDYKFNDATRVFAYYATVKAEGDVLVSTEATTDKTFALGFDFKF